MDWDLEIENLKKYVFDDDLSYEEIGRLYGCSGANIKKVMTKRGISLPVRSKNSGKSPVNKGTAKKYYCLNCGKELADSRKKYCDNKCQAEYQHKEWITRWKEGKESGLKGEYGISVHIKKYLFEKILQKLFVLLFFQSCT